MSWLQETNISNHPTLEAFILLKQSPYFINFPKSIPLPNLLRFAGTWHHQGSFRKLQVHSLHGPLLSRGVAPKSRFFFSTTAPRVVQSLHLYKRPIGSSTIVCQSAPSYSCKNLQQWLKNVQNSLNSCECFFFSKPQQGLSRNLVRDLWSRLGRKYQRNGSFPMDFAQLSHMFHFTHFAQPSSPWLQNPREKIRPKNSRSRGIGMAGFAGFRPSPSQPKPVNSLPSEWSSSGGCKPLQKEHEPMECCSFVL